MRRITVFEPFYGEVRSPVLARHEFAFNVFDVTLDFESGTVELRDITSASSEGAATFR